VSPATALAAIGTMTAVLLGWLGASRPQATLVPPWEFAAIAAAYFIAAAVAWRRRPENRIGRLMMGVGAGILAAMARGVPIAAVAVLSRAFLGINEVVLAYLLLAFPAGRLGPGLERTAVRLIIAVYGALAALQLLTVDTTADPYCHGCPRNPFRIATLPEVGGAATGLALLASGVLGGMVVILLVRRWLQATPAARRVLAPVLFAGALEAIGVATRALAVPDPTGAALVSRFAFLLEVTVPVALLVGFLRARLDRTSVADLFVEFGRAPSPERIEASLRTALRDPTLTVALWSEAARAYLGRDGRAVVLPQAGTDRAVTPLEHDGRPLAALLHDPALLDEPDLVASAAAALGLAVERDRLESSLRAQAADARRLPRGQVTLLFADIEGSTGLAERLGERWPDTLLEVRRLVAGLVRRAGGVEVDARADEYLAVFTEADAAVHASLAIQRGLAARAWAGGERVRLRIGLHAGTPELSDEGYVGAEVHRVARIGSAGHGGQVVLSESARQALGDDLPIDVDLVALGEFRLRGLDRPERLHQLVVPDLPRDFPPLRADLA
jgi:class 3 adenylate cyclase